MHACVCVCLSSFCASANVQLWFSVLLFIVILKQARSLSGKRKTPHNLLMLISSLHCSWRPICALCFYLSHLFSYYYDDFVFCLCYVFCFISFSFFLLFLLLFVCFSYTFFVCVCVCVRSRVFARMSFIYESCLNYNPTCRCWMVDVQCLKVRCIWNYQWNAPFSTLDVIRAMAQSVHPTMNYLQFLQFLIKWQNIKYATNTRQRLCLQL